MPFSLSQTVKALACNLWAAISSEPTHSSSTTRPTDTSKVEGLRISADCLRIHGLLERRYYKAYFDIGGTLTIGEGHTTNVHEGQTATDEEIDQWNRQDFMLVDAAIGRLVTVSLTQPVIDALALFINNVGVHAFERSTLLRKLNAGDPQGAQVELARWDHVGQTEIRGLAKRRLVEACVWQGMASKIDWHFIDLLLDYI